MGNQNNIVMETVGFCARRGAVIDRADMTEVSLDTLKTLWDSVVVTVRILNAISTVDVLHYAGVYEASTIKEILAVLPITAFKPAEPELVNEVKWIPLGAELGKYQWGVHTSHPDNHETGPDLLVRYPSVTGLELVNNTLLTIDGLLTPFLATEHGLWVKNVPYERKRVLNVGRLHIPSAEIDLLEPENTEIDSGGLVVKTDSPITERHIVLVLLGQVFIERAVRVVADQLIRVVPETLDIVELCMKNIDRLPESLLAHTVNGLLDVHWIRGNRVEVMKILLGDAQSFLILLPSESGVEVIDIGGTNTPGHWVVGELAGLPIIDQNGRMVHYRTGGSKDKPSIYTGLTQLPDLEQGLTDRNQQLSSYRASKTRQPALRALRIRI